MIDGLPVAASFNGGGVSTFIYDTPNADEMQVLVSGALGEAENGGPQVNLVPKAGGNTFKGSAFYSDAGTWSTGNNLDPTLISYGLTQPAGVISSWDASGSGGGPIKRDRSGSSPTCANTPPSTRYRVRSPTSTPATRRSGRTRRIRTSKRGAPIPGTSTRSALTGQVTPRNRVSFSHEYQYRCSGSTLTPSGDGCRVSEPGLGRCRDADVLAGVVSGLPPFPLQRHAGDLAVADDEQAAARGGLFALSVPLGGIRPGAAGRHHQPDPGAGAVGHVRPAELSFYRGLYDPLGFAYADNDANPNNWRATASYVTGAHNLKFGYQGSYQKSAQGRVANQTQLEYRFNNGIPNAVSYYLAPRWEQNDRTETHSLFAQDQWTKGRLTLQGGVRYDRAWSWAPAEGNGTSLTSRIQSAADQFPGNGQREGLQRHHAARGRRVRRVRQRQDGRQGEPRQVPAGRHQRRELLGQQPGRAHGDERAEPRLDRRQPQLRRGLQPAESGGAEQPGHRRRQLRRRRPATGRTSAIPIRT